MDSQPRHAGPLKRPALIEPSACYFFSEATYATSASTSSLGRL